MEKEPETLKDMNEDFLQKKGYDILGPTAIKLLEQLASAHIKYMRREGRDLYYKNIDEKSAIPFIIKFFNLSKGNLSGDDLI